MEQEDKFRASLGNLVRPASKLKSRKKTEEMDQLTKYFPGILEAKFQSPEPHRKLGLAAETYNPSSEWGVGGS